MYIGMNEQEREAMEHDMFAREDYLSEAFGAEARMLAAQAEDECNDPRTYGFFSEAGLEAANFEDSSKRRASRAIADAHASPVVDDCPF